MAKVVLDLEKLKHPNSGLGQFCTHLGQEIISNADIGFVGVYLPKSKYSLFPIVEKKEWKSYHKLTGVKIKTSVWHSFHQEAVYFPRDNTVKRVLSIHDLNFLDRYSGSKRIIMLNKLQKLVDHSSAVTFISNYTKSVAEKHLRFSPKTFLKVIYNGVALEKEIKSKKPYFIADFKPFLFSIGIVGEKKNFHVLIEMMLYLPDLKLYISGKKDSKYSEEIEGLINKHNLSSRVFLTGEITEAEKNWMYKNCSAFVFPSKNEGFGLPVVEAMSFGKPLVLSNLTSLPEIGGGLAAYFDGFQPKEMADIVIDAVNNHSLEKSIALIKRTELFSWNRAAKDYLAIYHQLLK